MWVCVCFLYASSPLHGFRPNLACLIFTILGQILSYLFFKIQMFEHKAKIFSRLYINRQHSNFFSQLPLLKNINKMINHKAKKGEKKLFTDFKNEQHKKYLLNFSYVNINLKVDFLICKNILVMSFNMTQKRN